MALDDKHKGPSSWQALEFVWDILFAIAIPTVLFALGGRWLDTRFGVTPLFTILGLILSFVVIAIIVMRKGKAMSKLL